MSQRRKLGAKKNRTIAYIAAGLVHLLILGAMLFNFTSKHESIEADFAEKVDIVKATTVDESQIKQQQNKLKQADEAKKRRERLEQERLEKLQRDSAKEEKTIEELKKKQEVEKEKTVLLENERKAIALKKQQELEQEKLAAEKRKREAQERERIEKERERKEKLAAEKKAQQRLKQQELDRIEAEEKELLASQEMNRMLQEEEAMLAAQRAAQRATTLRAKYAALIQEKVRRYRTISPDFERWRTNTVNVKLSSSGEVLSVRTIKSSGNVRYDRSVETAIYQASPLPIPSVAEDSDVNKMFRDLNLSFDMTGM